MLSWGKWSLASEMMVEQSTRLKLFSKLMRRIHLSFSVMEESARLASVAWTMASHPHLIPTLNC